MQWSLDQGIIPVLTQEEEYWLIYILLQNIIFGGVQEIPAVVIELELFDSVTSGLLRSESDLYAMCYDGSDVLMLPRCARAIETGHSILTSRLWYGSGLDCGLRKVYRVMQLADNEHDHAFGLRILPSYARALIQKDKLPAQGVLKGMPHSMFQINAHPRWDF